MTTRQLLMVYPLWERASGAAGGVEAGTCAAAGRPISYYQQVYILSHNHIESALC